MIGTDQPNDIQQTTPKFGTRLRTLRKARGMGLQPLADATGIDTSALSKMENGFRRPPELGALSKIATALGLVEGSTDFKYLWALALAERERNPDQATDTKALLGLLDLDAPVTEPEQRDANTLRAPVFCRSFSELVSKSIGGAISTQAWEITVRSASGETKYLLFAGHGREE